ncbi:MAG: CapA family protein [Armatimonadetes bacterium]|nr:CapA family protein [Armatimonadota bacterium]
MPPVLDADVTRLGLVGDVMLGRLVDEYVLADPGRDPAYVWGNTRALFDAVDLRLVNLECVIATRGEPWQRTPKVFHFRARPRALEALRTAGVHFVSLANNHTLDYGDGALRECLDLLRGAGIRFAGAGGDIQEAAAPACVTSGDFRCAVIALTDNEPAWEAGPDSSGVNYVGHGQGGLAEPYLGRVRDAIARARERAGFVIAAAHVGPNWGVPSAEIRALTRQIIDLGADLYWGHSNHTVQGIEIYRGKPILYSCGDFVDDYAVDPEERNDLSFFFELRVRGDAVERILLHPTRIGDFQVNLASGEDARWIRDWIAARSAEFGTRVAQEGDGLVVEVAPRDGG